MKTLIKSFIILLIAVLVVFQPAIAEANHSWKNYHWPREKNPFMLYVGDNLSPQWDSYLSQVSYDWGRSSRFDTRIVQGKATDCRGNAAHIQVCNSAYGKTGWLGLAQIGVRGDHIMYASAKLNDTYFTMSRYNTSAWKRLVMCQEVGHAIGLDHQDEDFGNKPLGTCMDYTNDPTPNQRPNMHDYYQLLDIYRHVDTTTTSQESAAIASSSDSTSLALSDTSIAAENSDPNEWGKLIEGTDLRGGGTTLAHDATHIAVFEKDLGNSKKVTTVVIWAQE